LAKAESTNTPPMQMAANRTEALHGLAHFFLGKA
jgi:hypothetical protein